MFFLVPEDVPLVFTLVVGRLQWTLESPEGLVNSWRLDPTPRVSDLASLPSSWVLLMLLVWGAHCEKHWVIPSGASENSAEVPVAQI